MKRLTALALCLTTVFTLGTSVSAATLSSTEAGSNSTEQQITGTYVDDDTEAIVYSVDITWSDFNFEYNTGSNGVWDPATHSYSEAKPKGWGDQKGTIKVTNHSNAMLSIQLHIIRAIANMIIFILRVIKDGRHL